MVSETANLSRKNLGTLAVPCSAVTGQGIARHVNRMSHGSNLDLLSIRLSVALDLCGSRSVREGERLQVTALEVQHSFLHRV